jgi:Ca2+/Na+ antiporter
MWAGGCAHRFQYKPNRWWFDFALMYNKIIFVLLTVLMDSDAQAWNLLAALTILTTATLLLVVVDKPFRDPEQPEADNIFTLADKLMIFSQMSQLLNYAVAAMCRLDEQSRIAQDGSRGTSDSVAFLAAVNGFGLVILQVLSLAYVYKKERQEQAENKNDKREEDTRTRRFNNPLTDQEDDEDDAAEEEADEAGESGDEADEEGDQDDVATR